MIASNVSTSNKNFVYGELTYYSGSYLTKYGWFHSYAADSYWIDQHHADCRRDIKYSITPCCNITVTKS